MKEKIEPYPWQLINKDDRMAVALLAELHKELSSGHILFGKQVRPIAKRVDNDDVLFELDDETVYALVHLTWSGKEEGDKRYPRTSLHQDLSMLAE